MKFLIFNLMVTVAIGYMLHERGALEGSEAGEVAEKTIAAIGHRAKPMIEDLQVEKKPEPDPEAKPAVDAKALLPPVAAEPDQQNQQPMGAAASSAKVSVDETVNSDVAARRDQVLGLAESPKPETMEAADKRAERRKRLHALAEEAEMLSIELIYR